MHAIWISMVHILIGLNAYLLLICIALLYEPVINTDLPPR